MENRGQRLCKRSELTTRPSSRPHQTTEDKTVLRLQSRRYNLHEISRTLRRKKKRDSMKDGKAWTANVKYPSSEGREATLRETSTKAFNTSYCDGFFEWLLSKMESKHSLQLHSNTESLRSVPSAAECPRSPLNSRVRSEGRWARESRATGSAQRSFLRSTRLGGIRHSTTWPGLGGTTVIPSSSTLRWHQIHFTITLL